MTKYCSQNAFIFVRPISFVILRHSLGPVAQLGERQVRNLEARGSIPLGSTINYYIAKFYSNLLWKRTMLPASNAVPMMNMPTMLGHKFGIPSPFKNMPRMISKKYLSGIASVIY